MSLTAAVIDALVQHGATAEMLAAAMKASIAEQDERLREKRAKDAERQRKSRASRNVTVTPCDTADVTDSTPSLSPSSSSSPDPSNNSTPAHTPTRSNAGTRTHAKGTRLPDDFAPKIVGQTAEMVSKWPPGRFDREVEQFRDHYAKTGGDKGLSRDWQASLRTWLRNADDRIPRNGQRPANDRPDEPLNPMVRAGIAREARFAGFDGPP